MSERLAVPLSEVFRDFAKDGRPCQKPLRFDDLPRTHEYWPELFALLGAEAGLAPEARNLLIGRDVRQLPRIHHVEPFRGKKAWREAGERSFRRRRLERPTYLILGRRPGMMAEGQRKELLRDALEWQDYGAGNDALVLAREDAELALQRIGKWE